MNIIQQKIPENIKNSSPLLGLWVKGSFIANNYRSNSKSYHPNASWMATYSFLNDTLMFRQEGSFTKSIRPYFSHYSFDNTILSIHDMRFIATKDTNKVYNSYKKWRVDFVNENKMLLYEGEHDRREHSYLYHKMRKRNINQCDFTKLSAFLLGNTFEMSEIKSDKDFWTPSNLHFLNDTSYIGLKSRDSLLQSRAALAIDSKNIDKALIPYNGEYIIDDFSVEGEIFLRLSAHQMIQVSEIIGDTLIGFANTEYVNKVKLVKQNQFLDYQDYQG